MNRIIYMLGVLGSLIAGLFGGWSNGLTILCIFMVIDFVTGILCGALGKSEKTSGGKLSSGVIFEGIIKKVLTLVMVIIGAQLDNLTGMNYIRDSVVVAYILTETISIIENMGLLGLPIPSIIKKVIEVLKDKNENIEIK